MIEFHNQIGVFTTQFPQWLMSSSHEDRDQSPFGRVQKIKVVIVDDEAIIADTLVQILQGEGFEAIAAYTGDSAVELALTQKADVVISDVVLPGMDGVEVGMKIRESLPACRIILFSGQAATLDLLRKAREHGHE